MKTSHPPTRLRRLLRQVPWALSGGAMLSCLAAGIFVQLPLPAELIAYRPLQSIRILDRNGGLLRELPATEEGSSRPVALSEIPDHFQRAILATEDAAFYSHRGISWPSIFRAAYQNIRMGRVVSGGSTITQQLARNLVHRPKGLSGKLLEALWAVRLEVHLTKEDILAQYLNRIPMGNRTFGVEAASELYFGRPARTLSLGQAALLAAIPKGPSAYNPYRKRERLEARRIWILKRMHAEAAIGEPLDLQISATAFSAPHFVEFVAAHLADWHATSAVEIQTSIDPKLQRDVEETVAAEISRLAPRRVSSGAVVVLDNLTGEVLAYVGSKDFFDDDAHGQNDGVQMRRQPGSALKPFLYAEAFSKGYSPASVLTDVETAYGAEKGAYAPKNYDRQNHGPVRAREALANSFNVPAVQVASDLGPDRFLETLHRAGFNSLTEPAAYYGLGLALGNGEVSLWELARAYSGLSRGGLLQPLRPLLSARESHGDPFPLSDEVKPRRFVQATSAALVTDILSDNAARSRAFGLDSALRLSFPVAAKTGTSKGYSDNWTVGFTHERTVAVWAGNFDGSSMVQVSGVTGAGPIFKRVMTRAMEGIPPAPLRRENVALESAVLCPLSGELAGPSCPSTLEEVFAPGTAPTHRCQLHGVVVSNLDPGVQRACARLAQGTGRVTRVGARFLEWAKDEGLTPDPQLAETCMGVADDSQPQLLSPSPGDEYMLFSDMPQKDQMVPVRILAAPKEKLLELWMDEKRVGELVPPFTGRVPAIKGQHVLAVKRVGSSATLCSASFRVRTEKTSW